MTMIPFHQVCKPNYLVIQFKLYKNILMLENYSSDPDTNCGDVILNFAQLNEDNKITNNLLNLKIELESGSILESTVLDDTIESELIIEEFKQHYYQFKDHLIENNQKVKNYFSEYQGDQLPSEVINLVSGNNCVDYQKLFGDITQLTIDYDGESYLIRDQYCMKPTCTCNEVIMVVYKADERLSNFVFRVDITNDQFEILKLNNDTNSDDLIKHIIEHKLPILKSRYDRMKEVGNQFSL